MALTQVSSAGIKNAEVKTEDILDANITTAKIAADAVTAAKIADDAVGAEHIEVLDADFKLADNVKTIFGDGNDIQIWHDAGAGDNIRGTGTKLEIRSPDLKLQNSASETYIRCISDGAVELYFDNSKKFETASYGVITTGTHQVTGNFEMVDNGQAIFGNGADLKIYHNGSHSYIDENGTGILAIRSNGTEVAIASVSGESMGRFINDGAVELYHNNVKKFETVSGGINVVGYVNVQSGGHVYLEDNGKLMLGTSTDCQIYHDGSNTYIDNNTGTLNLLAAGDVSMWANNNEQTIKGIANGAVELYFDNSKKLETTSTGATVIGELQIGDTSNHTKELRFADSTRVDASSIKVDNGSNADLLITNDRGSGSIKLATNSAERLRIDSNGRLLLGTTTEGHVDADDFTIEGSANTGLSIRSGSSNYGNIFFSDGTSGNDEIRGYIQYDHANNRMYFGANASHEVSILNGGGISFNGDTAAANALDDYEEGTWTPTAAHGSFSSTNAKYTKIGRMVYATYEVTFSSTSGTSHQNIGGLPFAVAQPGGVSQDYHSYGAAYINHVTGSNIWFYNAAGTYLTESNLAGKQFRGTAVYYVA